MALILDGIKQRMSMANDRRQIAARRLEHWNETYIEAQKEIDELKAELDAYDGKRKEAERDMVLDYLTELGYEASSCVMQGGALTLKIATKKPERVPSDRLSYIGGDGIFVQTHLTVNKGAYNVILAAAKQHYGKD